MLTSVEVRNSSDGVLNLSLMDPSNGFVIRSIDGLDPVKATIVTSNFAQLDGAEYQSSRREARNLVFKLGLEPDYAEEPLNVRQLRAQLYSYFMPKSVVSLAFADDEMGIVYISGRVESFESPLFTQDPEATISLICVDPDFQRGEFTEISGVSGTPVVFDYEGTSPVGILFTAANLAVELEGFRLNLSNSTNQTGLLEFISPLSATNKIAISTVVGDKYARRTLAGTTPGTDGPTSSVLWGVSPYSDWLALAPGMNTFEFWTGKAATPFTLRFRSKFGGL